MTEDTAAAAVAAADELADVRPAGQIRIVPALLEVIYERIAAAGAEDPAIPPAVAQGDAVATAIDAGCPPQFHPGVPPEYAAVLEDLRARLGLDRVSAIELAADTDPSYVRALRAIGCTLVRASD